MKSNYKARMKGQAQQAVQGIEARAAERVAWLSLIALNETEGFGRVRLMRYAQALCRVSEEFAEQSRREDVAYTRLAQRITQLMGEEYCYNK